MRRAGRASRASATLAALAAIAGTPVALHAQARSTAESSVAAIGGLATFKLTAEASPTERLLDGTVEAVNQATVSAQTAGRVAEIYFDVNDSCRPARSSCAAQHGAARGSHQAQAALNEAAAREAEAQTRYGRIDDMHERKVVAKATLDEATAERDAAVARLAAARAVERPRRVSYTEVRAPYAGIVTQRHVQVGESVSPGTPLMSGPSLDAPGRAWTSRRASSSRCARWARPPSTWMAGASRPPRHHLPVGRPESTLSAPASTCRRTPRDCTRDVRQGGFRVGEADRLLVPRRRSSSAARCAASTSWLGRPRGAPPGSPRAVRDDRVEILAGAVAGERVALDPCGRGPEGAPAGRAA